jgi:hypothetical protein
MSGETDERSAKVFRNFSGGPIEFCASADEARHVDDPAVRAAQDGPLSRLGLDPGIGA